MANIRNFISHWQAKYYLWRTAIRTTQTNTWATDPNRYDEFDSPAYERPALKG